MSDQKRLDIKWEEGVKCIREGKLEAAMFIFKSLYSDGENAACREVALLYEAQKHYSKAVKWYTKAIEEADDIEGALGLARLYFNGQGVSRSISIALDYLDLVEDNNNHKAFLLKARILCSNNDMDEAEYYYKKAYQLGNVVALSELASIDFYRKRYFKWIQRKLFAAFLSFKIARKDVYSEYIRTDS